MFNGHVSDNGSRLLDLGWPCAIVWTKWLGKTNRGLYWCRGGGTKTVLCRASREQSYHNIDGVCECYVTG